MNVDTSLRPNHLAQRELTPEDLPQVLALHQLCTQGLSDDFVRKETMASLQSLMQRGQFIGLFDQQQLVAYGVLLNNLQPHERLPESIAPDSQRPQSLLCGISVAPAWRGHGLQRRLIMQRLSMASADALVFSTAAPANWYSWNNLLECGFHVRAITDQYGGHTRFLMVAEPLPAYALYPDLSKEFHGQDLKRQQEALSEGWRGAQPGHTPEFLRYVPTRRGKTA